MIIYLNYLKCKFSLNPNFSLNSYIFLHFRCKAVLGMSENITRVTLHENCFLKGIIIHELMHVLGFMHEQNRPDRDDFVKIDFDNIEEGNF